jgi:sigma-B regulation protein RsbU (phosphoserine phosphatase)
MTSEPTYENFVADEHVAVVGMDGDGILSFMNPLFTSLYGWRQDIVGQPLTVIMPPHMRQAHTIGFSRMISTGKPKLLGKPVQLPVLHADGHIVASTLVIVGEKQGDSWRFAATFQPLPSGDAS